MKKAITVTALIAMISEAFYLVVCQLLAPFVLYPLIGARSPMRVEDATVYYVAVTLIRIVIVLLIYIGIGVYLIFAAGGKSENIAPEIISLIVLGFVLPLASSVIGMVTNLLLSRNMGLAVLGDYSTLSSAASMLGFMGSASSIMMFLAIGFSIAKKKYLLPLQYEQGIGVEYEGYPYNSDYPAYGAYQDGSYQNGFPNGTDQSGFLSGSNRNGSNRNGFQQNGENK